MWCKPWYLVSVALVFVLPVMLVAFLGFKNPWSNGTPSNVQPHAKMDVLHLVLNSSWCNAILAASLDAMPPGTECIMPWWQALASDLFPTEPLACTWPSNLSHIGSCFFWLLLLLLNLSLVRFPGFQLVCIFLQKFKNGFQLACFQWHNHITFGWPLALHQARDGHSSQGNWHHFWILPLSLLGWWLWFIFIGSIPHLVLCFFFGPYLVPLGNEVLELWMVGKGSILVHFAIHHLVNGLGSGSELQPQATTMFLQQGGRHWNSFAIIATDGANPLDVYLHVVCIWSNGYTCCCNLNHGGCIPIQAPDGTLPNKQNHIDAMPPRQWMYIKITFFHEMQSIYYMFLNKNIQREKK